MSSSILHSCPFCGHVTDISEILADFVGNPHCNQCGLSASEGNLKVQDDLVSLFNAHMNMESPPMLEGEGTHASPPPITYSITQHYHHSTHVVQKPAAPEPISNASSSRANEPVTRVLDLLRDHSVDPSCLSSSQLELFINAMPEQQSRLIQMWQICPEPSKSVLGFTQSTEDHEMCGSTQLDHGDNANQSAEPYMLAGYDLGVQNPEHQQIAPPTKEPTTGYPYRQFSDPIFQAGGQRWWERTEPMAMEI
ncbi:hypothetical protein BDV06DRAFT_223729 [Aspergillus oleicola]